MVGVYTKENVVNAVFFTKSRVNDVVISTLELIKIYTKNNRITHPICGPKGHER